MVLQAWEELSVAFSSDATPIVFASDRHVQVLDASTGRLLKFLKGHTDVVRSVALSSDGTRIVSGSMDKSVRVWDASTGSTGAELGTLNGHTKGVTSIAFSSDGRRIVSGSWDNSVRMWDASTGAELKTLNGHTENVLSVAFSSDGTRIVSGSGDQSVGVWDALTGAEFKVLNGHTGAVSAIAPSSDGTRIASGSADCSVRVWDIMDHDKHWVPTPDNWIISLPYSQHLLCMPPEFNQALCPSPTLLRVSREGCATTLNFTNSKVGTEWAECYASSAF